MATGERLLLSWSGGKDSALTLAALRADPTVDVVGLLTSVTRDYDRVSIHGVRRGLLEAQARAVGLPFVPVYRVSVEVPNAARLTNNNEIRIGGTRVGVVESIEAVRPSDSTSTALASSPSMASTAHRVSARRSCADATTLPRFCHGSPATTSSTRSNARRSRTSAATTMCAVWTGSNVPPNTPTR